MLKQWRKLLIFLMIAAVGTGLMVQSVEAAGVDPLEVDLTVQPGSTKEFKLTLTPGDKEETVKLSLYKLSQLTDGSLAYRKAGSNENSAVDWVQLESNEVRVYPKQKSQVTGKVKVPIDAKGSHTVVVMVEPQATNQQQGIKFRVRYAVRLNIRIKGFGLKPKIDLVNLGIVPNKVGELLVKTKVFNPSGLDYLASSKVTIRDSNRRLVEKVDLKTLGNLNQGEDGDTVHIYPNSKIEFLGKINKRLEPGEYYLRAFIKYGDYGQLVRKKKIKIEEEEFALSGVDEDGAFTIEPQEINLELKPGQRKSEVIKLNSELIDTAKIVISKEEVKPNYEYSLLDWSQLRGRTEFKLQGKSNGRAILTMAVPQEVEAGSYHGRIMVKAYHPRTKELLIKKRLPISILVGEPGDYDLQVRDLSVKEVKDGQLLSLKLLNSGEVFVEPQVSTVITDENGNFVEQVILKSSEEERILPLKEVLFTGKANNLRPGSYKAMINVKYKGQELVKVERRFEVIGS